MSVNIMNFKGAALEEMKGAKRNQGIPSAHGSGYPGGCEWPEPVAVGDDEGYSL